MGKDSLLNNYAPDHPFVTGDSDGLNRVLGWGYSCDEHDYEHFEDEEEHEEEEKDNEGHTYDKWQSLGYQVKRGEKAAYNFYGKSIFTKDQVTKIKSRYISHCWKCYIEVDSQYQSKCSNCGWLECPGCGSCRCNKP